MNLPNSDPRTSAGGMAGCSYSGFRRANAGEFMAGWSSAGAAIDAAGQFTTLDSYGFRAVGVAMPQALGYLEYDRFGRERARRLYIGPGDMSDVQYPKAVLREYRVAG